MPRIRSIKPEFDDLTLESVLGILKELSRNGLIETYTVDEIDYLQVTGWHHQRIDKPQPAKFPGIEESHSQNTLGLFPPDRIGKDRIGKDRIESEDKKPEKKKSKRQKPKLPPPDNFLLNPEMRKYAAGKNINGKEVDYQFEKFKDYHLAKGSCFADWNAAWRTWINNAVKWSEDQKGQEQPWTSV